MPFHRQDVAAVLGGADTQLAIVVDAGVPPVDQLLNTVEKMADTLQDKLNRE